MNKYKPIAVINITAIATQLGWIRSAKTIYISESTPAWAVRLITEWMEGAPQ